MLNMFTKHSFMLCLCRCLLGTRRQVFLTSKWMRCYNVPQIPVLRPFSTYSFQTENTIGQNDFNGDGIIPNKVTLLLRNLRLDVSNRNRINKADLEMALDDFKSRGQLTEDNGKLLLQCCDELIVDLTEKERVQLIWKIWDVLKHSKRISLELYHTLLTSLSKNAEPISVEKILNEITQDGFTPTVETYSSLLLCLCESGDIAAAINLVNKMKQQNVSIGEPAFNALAFGFGKSGNMKAALEVLETMRLAKIAPTSRTYCNLLRAAAENGDEIHFNLICTEMRQKSMKLSTRESLLVVRSLTKGGKISLIPEFLGNPENWMSNFPMILNLCVQLLYVRSYDTVFEILRWFGDNLYAMPNSRSNLEYLIEEMIITRVPIRDVIRFCNQARDSAKYLLSAAAHATLKNGMQQEAYKLFRQLKRHQMPLRPHYFWPFLIIEGKERGEEGVLEVLLRMTEHNVEPDFDTFRGYMFPYMNLTNPLVTIRKLQDRGFTVNSFLTPLLATLLYNDMLQESLDVARVFKGKYHLKFLEKPLIMAFTKQPDVWRVVELVQKITHNSETVSTILKSVLRRNIEPKVLYNILQGIGNADVRLTWSALEDVKNYMRRNGLEEVQEEWLSCLDKNIIYTDRPVIPHPSDMDLSDLEDHLIQLKSKGMNTRGALRRLLIMHAGLGNVQRAHEIIQEVEAAKHEMSPGMKAAVLELYCRENDAQNALRALYNLKLEHPTFHIDSFKYVNLALALVNANNFEKAIDVLEEQNPGVRTEMLSERCWHLLNTVANKCSPEETKLMLKTLVRKNYCHCTNKLLGPVIRCYIRNGDIDGCIDQFLKYARKFQVTPMKFEVLKEVAILCENGDAKYEKQLEELIEVCSKIDGMYRANVIYIIALAEANCLKRLRKFLAESSPDIHTKVLKKECDRLSDRNKLDTLLNLARVLTNFPTIDVDPVFVSILKIYSRRGDYDSGLKLLTMIEGTDRIPSKEFLSLLSSVLTSNKQEVPFKI